MSEFPFWKNVYRTVTGSTSFVLNEDVSTVLNECKEELLKSLLIFKPYVVTDVSWKPTEHMSLGMQSFVNELGRELNLETNVAYLLSCNYLMYDYFGKIKEFWKVTEVGTTAIVKENIFNFYVAERMFLLKVWRHILENIHANNKFYEQFRVFIDTSISLEDFQDNLIQQYQELVLEEVPKSFFGGLQLRDCWFCRNKREQIEVLSVLALTVQRTTITNSRIFTLFNIFIQNNFGAQPPLPDTTKHISLQDQQDLLYAHIVCFFIIWEKQWKKNDASFWQSSDVTLLDRSIIHLSNQQSQCLFATTWLGLKFKMWNSAEDGADLMKTFEKVPFETLELVLQHPMCQNTVLGEIMHEATYKIIDELCLVSSDQKELFTQQGLVSVFAEILKKPSLYRLCLKERRGVDEIFNIAIAVFPFFFNEFSNIAASLLEHERCYSDKTLELLTRFPSYLSQMKWSKAQESIYVLQEPIEIHPGSALIVFPPETTVGSYSICDVTLVQYKTPYNYFLYVEYLVECLMKIIMDHQPLDDYLVLRIEYAYKVIIALIKHDSRNLAGLGILNLFHRLNNLQVSLKGYYMKYTLMKHYFIMQKILIVDRNFRYAECTPNFIWTSFFPVITLETDGMHFAFKDTTFTTLFRDESLRRDHSVVCSYVEILASLVKTHSNYHTSVQLSGVVYILDSIFSHHLRWSFEDDNQRALITLKCLSIFEFVLSKDRHKSNEHIQKMFDFCKQALLYDGDIIDTFLSLFVTEKNHLIFLMERETNWVRGPSLIKFDCIRQQLSLLLVLMNISEGIERCVFRLKVNFVVKPITSYFTNFYNPDLAKLSCKFLEMIAKDSDVSLLPLLELDHYQVQTLFLEKLRDSLENDHIKIAIINLINTCVANQDGMTAAFFNLKCFHYWDGSETDIFSGDSICDFMIDYLQNLRESDEYLKNPLQLGILYLFKTLWVNHRERLVENIARLSDFWPVMLRPFLNDFVQDVNVYQTILKIINMEINITKGGDMLHPKFVKTLKLFVHDNKRLKDWFNFVTKSSFESEKNILLLNTWTEFLVVSNKVWPEIFTEEMKKTIIDSFLNGLNMPYSGSHHLQILYTWVEVYLILLSSWNQHHNVNIVQKLTTFLRSLRTYYKRIEARIREVILSIIFKTIEGGADFFADHSRELLEILYPLNWMLEDEFTYLSEVWRSDDSKIVQHLRPWLLVMLIGKSLLNLKNGKQLGLYFHSIEYIPKILSTFIHLIQNQKTFSFAKLALEYLIQHALSPLAEDFLDVDLIAFYGEIRPPILKISLGDALSDGLSANLKDWWLILILLIKLHTILLNEIGVKFLPSAFSFIKQHDKVFFEMISLTKHTVDLTALTLVHETLQFFYAVKTKKPVWFAEEPESYQLLLAATKTTLNACVLSVVGYKKLNFYEIPFEKKIQPIDEPDVDLTVTVLNKLCEIIYWSCIVLTQTLPHIIDEFCTVIPDEPINLLVRNDFSVPRFELPIPCELTYGMLLCLADFLCKTLNQLSPDTPQTTPRSQKVDMTTLKENRLEIVYQHCTVIYHKFIGFMVYVQRSDELPSDSISSLLHYDPSVSSSSSLLSLLDYQFVRYALEALMRLLLTEIFYAVRVFEEEVLVTFRRELTSEIQFFYEFVRKRTTELYNRSTFDQMVTLTPQPLHADVINKYFALQVGANNGQVIYDDNFIIVVALWFIKVLGLNN